ncbi:MAG: MFS transporter [Chloroflexota bacterium]|nr:MFS transporter [Chloroflexota bacterium]
MPFISCLAVFLSGPAQTYGVSVFVDPMLAELGWSRSLFSTLYSLGTLASAGALVFVGRQIDRVGNRVVLTIAVIGFGASMLLLSTASGVFIVFLSFAMLRTFGSGVLTLAARNLVPNWFHSRAGRAFSLIGLAAMLSQAVVPLFNNLMIDMVGWCNARQVNAIIMWVLLLPIVAIAIRNRPADIGQFPDDTPPARDDITVSADDAKGVTLHAALRTTTFWFLIGASVVPSLVVTGLASGEPERPMKTGS